MQFLSKAALSSQEVWYANYMQMNANEPFIFPKKKKNVQWLNSINNQTSANEKIIKKKMLAQPIIDHQKKNSVCQQRNAKLKIIKKIEE